MPYNNVEFTPIASELTAFTHWRNMKLLFIPVCLLAAGAFAASNLVITPADDGTEYLWLSWLDESDTGFLMRYDGTQFETWLAFGSTYNGISSTITLDPSGGMHLIVAVENVLLSVDPFGDMATADSIVLPYMAEWHIPGLLRRSAVPGWGLLGRYMASYMSSGAEFFWTTREYTVSESGEITMGDSLMMEDPYPATGSNYPEDLVHNLVFPVMNASGCPVMAERQAVPRTPASFYIASQCHNTTASSVYLTADTLTWSTIESTEPEMLASGSNETEAVFLWSDSTTTVYYSIHDCDTGFTLTAPFPGQGPSSLCPAAISANPEDPGMLLAWRNGNDIFCRHYQNGWNDYAYLIAEDVPAFPPGKLAVCSVEYGYWVAYTIGSDAEVIFVNREDLTEMTETCESVDPLQVDAYPNPFSSALTVTIPGERLLSASLYDNFGRIVQTGSGAGSVIMETESIPSGCYLLRVSSGESRFTGKVVLVR